MRRAFVRHGVMVTTLFLGIAVVSSAQDDGAGTMEDLVRSCNGDSSLEQTVDAVLVNTFNKGFCMGYLSGILSFNAVIQSVGEAALFCPPPQGISVDQAAKLFLKHAEERPESLHETARVHVPGSLRLAFPCNE